MYSAGNFSSHTKAGAYNMKVKKVSSWFSNHTVVMYYLLTAIICWAEYRFLPDHLEYAFLITFLAALCLLVCLYAALFGPGCRNLFPKILCALLIIVFANRLYKREILNAALPVLSNLSDVELSVLLLCIALIAPMMASLVSNAADQSQQEESTELPPTTSTPTKSKPGHGLRISVFALILLAMIAAACYIFGLIFTQSESTLDSANFFDITALLSSYGGTLLLVLVMVLVVLFVFVEAIRFVFARIMAPLPAKGQEQKPPIYVFSVIITIILFYLSYSVGGFSLDDFTDFSSNGRYLAFPLAITVVLVAFFVIVRVIHGVILILMEVKADAIKNFISEKEKSSHINERLYTIFQIILDLVLGTILTALRFVLFIPNFFRDLYNLVFLEDGDEVENDFVTLAHTHSEERDEAADTEVSLAEEAEPAAPQDITPDADTPPSEE